MLLLVRLCRNAAIVSHIALEVKAYVAVGRLHRTAAIGSHIALEVKAHVAVGMTPTLLWLALGSLGVSHPEHWCVSLGLLVSKTL